MRPRRNPALQRRAVPTTSTSTRVGLTCIAYILQQHAADFPPTSPLHLNHSQELQKLDQSPCTRPASEHSHGIKLDTDTSLHRHRRHPQVNLATPTILVLKILTAVVVVCRRAPPTSHKFKFSPQVQVLSANLSCHDTSRLHSCRRLDHCRVVAIPVPFGDLPSQDTLGTKIGCYGSTAT
ncbi:hypothetical protein BDN72DRAFT_395379 [Pluteus cervinus]|uniref:Uncharacterized protein n=1 Tax=Pluteus cervinus TaxID=181527 RepID=A0ACD3A9F0_9AGAR|nr:hypothetical protein BDN72DRAFT_395379 [Pluteus cervinus]